MQQQRHGRRPTVSVRPPRAGAWLRFAPLLPGLLAAGIAAAQPDVGSAASVQGYEIPAGSLADALSRFAGDAGVSVAIDPALVEGLRSPGLSGRYSVRDGFARLLAGTELQASEQASGIYVLRRSPPVGTAPEPVVTPAAAVPEPAPVSEVVVLGTSNATGLYLSSRETPQSLTVVGEERMREQNLNEIAEVLEQVVGVESNRSGALGTDSTGYVARGFFVQNYQVDGIARPTNIYGFAEETADMVAYDRVEIIRGSTGLMTGIGQPSATINLVRKRPTETFTAHAAAGAGSWDLNRFEADAGGPLSEGGRVRGRVAGAWQENGSFVERERPERRSLYGVVEADATDSTTLTGGLEWQDFENTGGSRGGVPLYFTDGTRTNFPRSANAGARWSDFHRESVNGFVSLVQRFGRNWRLQVDAEHKDGQYDETIGYLYAPALDHATGDGGDLLSGRWASDLRLDAIYANLQGGLEVLGLPQRLALTLSHARYRTDGPGYPLWWAGDDYWRPVNVYQLFATGDVAEPDLGATGDRYGHDARTSAVAGVLRLKPAERVAVILGSRFSDWKESSWDEDSEGHRTITPGIKENGVWTPYAGLVVDLTRSLSAYASYASIFEPHSEQDVSGKKLQPLEGNTYELGLKAELFSGRLNASAALFRMEQDNYAEADGGGIYAPDGSVAYHAVSGLKAQGFELEAGGEIMPGWKIAGGFANAKAEDRDGQRLLAEIPKNSFKLFSSYALRGAFDGLTVGGNLRWRDKTTTSDGTPDGQTYKQDALVLVDLLVRYRLAQHYTLSLNIDNLLDENYYSALYISSSRPGEPRNIVATLRYDF
ncbi:TonB-dependent siderophore receptor [Solimonas soli]|uniref:TonB-dependent siderophore receptor n=1 Tax=Solimonas soli TaxID=413479 RepID=UPI0004B8849D|nr:TonB-dependent receptor [Solimonas soli]